MKNITIKDIAREAKVSTCTVSHALNDTRYVKKETKERIKKIVKKYGYRPSYVASAMVTGRTRSVAIIVPSLKEPSVIEIVNSVEMKLSEHGYSLNIYDTGGNFERELEIIEIINRRTIDGVIAFGINEGKENKIIIQELDKRKIPLVFVVGYVFNSDVPYVAIDDYKGGKITAEYLLSKNHKSFGLVFYDSKINIFKERKKGFLEILKKNGLCANFILELPADITLVKDKIIENKDIILSSDVSAVFASTDMIAIYLLDLYRDNNIKIPEEVSLIGFDNIIYSGLVSPKLTTIDYHQSEIGALAVENLINKIEKNKFLKKKIVIDPNIIERESVKGL